MEIHDVVIIGAGPAAIAAAIQLKRYNIVPLLIEENAIGGLLRNANLVENYPGFPDGVRGVDLVELMKKHLVNAGIGVNFEKVVNLKHKDNLFITRTDRREIFSRIVVIATGTKPKELRGLPPIPDDIKNKIFYEVLPLRNVENKKIAIIGAGDAAFDYALGLAKKNKIVVLNRNENPNCIPALREKCEKTENIKHIRNVIVKEMSSSGSGVLLNCAHADGTKLFSINVDYIVIAIGREPRLGFLDKELGQGIESLVSSGKLYLAGDVKNGTHRQTAISVGDGVKAAMDIYRHLKGIVT